MPSVVTVTANQHFAVNRWNVNYTAPTQSPSYAVDSQSQANANGGSNLPLSMDPVLAVVSNSIGHQVKRHLVGDNFSQKITMRSNCFVVTVDSTFLIACGFWDNSFRVFSTESAKICNITSDYYIASGSEDCTVLLWHWNARLQSIVGEGEQPTPRAILTGHDQAVYLCCHFCRAGSRHLWVKRWPHLSAHNIWGSSQVFGFSVRFILPLQYSIIPRGTCRCPLSQWTHCFIHFKWKKSFDMKRTTIHSTVSFYLEMLFYMLFLLVTQVFVPLTLSHDQKFLLGGLSTGSVVVFHIDFNRWHHEFQQRY
ncbi:Neurobeachin [Lepeophtheirus salmonis]|uniref:Neurobeachin n=1 Tax=Lepeophtheirus salmonis TaxID=72036 RepID=A0A7R8D031_LEPSM|nr:Neurobeachin [Lepeophtheirus salmonis]CAF2980355.1 Neurobeachin [Lepeophtheirus salmonis]